MARKKPCLQCPKCRSDVPGSLTFAVPDEGGRGWPRWLAYDGDRHACPSCGAELVVDVTDDYSEDSVASLVEVKRG